MAGWGVLAVVVIVLAIGQSIWRSIKQKEKNKTYSENGYFWMNCSFQEQNEIANKYYGIWKRIIDGIMAGMGINTAEADKAGIVFPDQYLTFDACTHVRDYCNALAQIAIVQQKRKPCDLFNFSLDTFDPVNDHYKRMSLQYPNGVVHTEMWNQERKMLRLSAQMGGETIPMSKENKDAIKIIIENMSKTIQETEVVLDKECGINTTLREHWDGTDRCRISRDVVSALEQALNGMRSTVRLLQEAVKKGEQRL